MSSYSLNVRNKQTMEFTKRLNLKGNGPEIDKLKAELTIVMKEGVRSEEILDIESCNKELVVMDVVNALKNRKNYNIFLRDHVRRSVP